jgi:hypothetical protein
LEQTAINDSRSIALWKHVKKMGTWRVRSSMSMAHCRQLSRQHYTSILDRYPSRHLGQYHKLRSSIPPVCILEPCSSKLCFIESGTTNSSI